MRLILAAFLALAPGAALAACPGTITDCASPTYNALTANSVTINTGLSPNSYPVFTSIARGAVPASGGGTSNFLRADGSWVPATASGTVTTTGSPANGNLTKFSGATTVTNGDLSGDVTTSGALATTVAKIGGFSVSLAGSFTTSGANALTFTTTGPTNVTLPTSGTLLAGNQTITLSGDATGSGATAITTTLATVNTNTGTWGDGTHVGQFTVNGKGLITAASSVAITGAAPTGSAGGDLGGSYPNPTVLSVADVTIGVLGSTHGGAGSVTGALKANGSGTVTQAACADLSNGATGCSAPTGTSGATIPLLNGTNVWSAQQSGSITTLAISTATFTPDGTNNNYSITLVHASCPCTLANPSATPVAGTQGIIYVIQSATGSDTIGTWGSDYLAPGGTATITLSTGANAVDVLAYTVKDSTHILLSPVYNFSH